MGRPGRRRRAFWASVRTGYVVVESVRARDTHRQRHEDRARGSRGTGEGAQVTVGRPRWRNPGKK
eukprot:5095157-Prymnesium_polylepis.1